MSQLLTRGATYTGANGVSSTVFIDSLTTMYIRIWTTDRPDMAAYTAIPHRALTRRPAPPGLNGDGKIDGNVRSLAGVP